MAHLAVHRNANERTCGDVPYLLDVQSPLLGELATRVVIPLRPLRTSGSPLRAIRRLTPEIEVAGEAHLLMTPEMAGIPRVLLGEAVADLSEKRGTILGAIDLLITGF